MMNSKFRIILANIIGTAFEVYELAIYAFFSPIIAANFFPADNKNIALVNTFGIFLVGFLIRPFGALLFGHIGDIVGRKKPLMLTILIGAFATFSIGLLPTTHQVGILAPILLAIFRALQGLSMSGEYVGSLVFLFEKAPIHQRGAMTSWVTCGGNIGLLVASLLSLAIIQFTTHEQLMAWGWRIPFLSGLLGGCACAYLRSKVSENYQLIKTDNYRIPIIQVITRYKKLVGTVVALCGLYMLTFYLLFYWSITYFTQILHLSFTTAMIINSLALIQLVIVVPFFAKLSDKIGRKPLVQAGIISLIICIYPYYCLLQTGNVLIITLAHLGITMCMNLFTSTLPVVITEIMPKEIRYTGTGLGYNFAAMCVGGATPLLAMLLITQPHGAIWLSAYLIFWALIAWIGTLYAFPTRHQDVTEFSLTS